MKRIIQSAGLLTLGLFVTACGDSQSPAVQSRVALQAFGSCSELESYIEDVAVDQMRAQLDSYGQVGIRGGSPFLAGTQDAASANSAGAPSSAPTAYTKTNAQVEGVDEADFMKTDGTRIFVLSGQKLYVVKSWPAQDMRLASNIDIQGWPREMFLDEEGRIVIFSNYYPNLVESQAPYWCSWGCGQSSFTKVTVIDASDENNLRVSHQMYLPGSYANARRIGDSVRIVVRDYLQLPEGVRYWPEWTGDWEADDRRFKAAIDDVKQDNERLIRARSLDQWLPQARAIVGSTEQIIPRNCSDFSRPNAQVRLGLASIATLKLTGDEADLHMTTVLGEVGEVYASHDHLYIASPHWWWWPQAGQQSYTYMHKFDITNSSRATYVASGGVQGYLLNQFSMDEHEGFLRVATTIDRWSENSDGWFDVDTTNRITVLGERSGHLIAVGATRDLADNERIQSARFMGDKGYLVTFETVDPLFTVDLHDPTNPRVIGELKIPGFSSYMHPLDENNILAIGVHIPEPDSQGRVDWSQRYMKLSIFDVSDFANPRQKFEQVIGTAHGWSEAAWEHKAFNYFPERGMLAVPFSDYISNGGDYWDGFISDLRLFHIDVDTGITPRGSIDMREIYREVNHREWSWSYSPWIRRSVMADDFAYAISDAGIRVANMNSPQTPVATVLFEGATVGR